MAKSRAEKEASLELIRDRLGHTGAAVLADYRGLDVAEATDLRRRLRAAGVEYHVLKNTLLRMAAKEAGLDELMPLLVGPTAIAFSGEDPTAAARELAAFLREHPDLAIKGGMLGTKVIDTARVQALAALPPREVLLARTAGAFAAPMSAFATVLAAPLRQLAVVIDNLRSKRAAEA